MSALDEAEHADLHRLQRAVYGPDAGADAGRAQEQLRVLQASVRGGRSSLPADAALAARPSPQPPAGDGAVRTRFGQHPLSPMERVLWAGIGALGVAVLVVAGFFLGALTAPHPDRLLVPVVQAESGVVSGTDVADYREFMADGMKIGIGTIRFDGAGPARCLYVGGPRAHLRSGALSGICAPESAYGTTWEVAGDVGTGSSLFGLGVRDSIRFIERDSGLEVWLSREPT